MAVPLHDTVKTPPLLAKVWEGGAVVVVVAAGGAG
jgi:hypothetical protein